MKWSLWTPMLDLQNAGSKLSNVGLAWVINSEQPRNALYIFHTSGTPV